VSWDIWIAKNNMTFQGKEILPIQVCEQVRYAYGGTWKPVKIKMPTILFDPEIDKSAAWKFFDGAYQGTPSTCGAGGILFLKEKHSLLLNMQPGWGKK
jgi:hypothetical protein